MPSMVRALRRLMLRHLTCPWGVTGVARRRRLLSRGVPRMSTRASGRVLRVRLLAGCRGSVLTMRRVALLGCSCTSSGAVSRVCLRYTCGAVLAMSGVVLSGTGSRGMVLVSGSDRTVGYMTRSRRTARAVSCVRLARLRSGTVSCVRIRGASMGRVRGGCHSMTCVWINSVRNGELRRRIRHNHGFRCRIGAIRRAARREREAR